MTIRIKICGLTRKEDIETAIAAGSHAIGFVFYPPSKRYVSPEKAKELVKHIPPFCCRTGLFVNASQDEIKKVLHQVDLDLLQFHGDESVENCMTFQLPFIKAIRVNPETDWLYYLRTFPSARAFILDAHVDAYGGSGKTFDWSLIPADFPRHKLILSGGLDEHNVAQAINMIRPAAVDVSSGVEPTGCPGIKDAVKIHRFISAVQKAGATINR